MTLWEDFRTLFQRFVTAQLIVSFRTIRLPPQNSFGYMRMNFDRTFE